MVFKKIKLPQRLLDRLTLILPRKKFEAVLHAYSIKRPTTIRANTLKIHGWELRQRLLDQGIKADTVFWNKEAFIVRNKVLKELRLLKDYQEGYFYVQSLSSMIPPLVLNPKPGEKVLDIAAAPGSKTTQMAAMMENKGEIVANEPNNVRYQKLDHNLKIQGITNTKLISMQGEIISNLYSDYFDKVLVDAPCSGEGRISMHYQDSFGYWSFRNVSNYAHLQKKLLAQALLTVKPGGTVVYSTCTLSPEENEEVVNWILERTEGKVVLENVSVGTLRFSQPVMKWGEKNYLPHVRKTARIIPSDLMEGLFTAKLKRIE